MDDLVCGGIECCVLDWRLGIDARAGIRSLRLVLTSLRSRVILDSRDILVAIGLLAEKEVIQ